MIGGLATMPSRYASLESSIGSIACQVDHLYVYLDKYDEIPGLLKGYNNVSAILPADAPFAFEDSGGWQAAGKFIGALHVHDCVYFTFDDDILYPLGYTNKLATSLEAYQYKALVGIHASTLCAPHQSYLRDKRRLHFEDHVRSDQRVDILGSGTLAFRTSTFMPDFRNWKCHALGHDLMVAIDAHRVGLPRIALARNRLYLKAIAQSQEDSLYLRQQRDDSILTTIMRENSQLWT